MNKIKILICVFFSIPKTIYFNFKVFKFKIAIKLPVYVSNNVELKSIYKNCIEIKNNNIKMFMIKIGIAGSEAIQSQKGLFFLDKKQKGKIIFHGTARFGTGIRIYNKGTIEFGNNFVANKNCFIASDNKIAFGKDVLLGWNINIRDSDGHKIIQKERSNKENSEVIIGNHVWICSYVDILKGSHIGNDCVIAYRSCLIGINCENNMLIGGYPAKIIKENINWEK